MRRVALIVLGALSAAGLSASSAASATVTVTVGPGGDFSYFPNPQPIQAGDTIHWVWGSNLHSTTSGTCNPQCVADGKWDSDVLNSGATFDHTFTTPGTYPYYCTVHGSSMRGTITVSGPTAATFTSFSAARTDRGVVVSWRTASELDTLGFEVYRERGDRRVSLTRRPIPAHGGVRGASYSILDRAPGRRGEPVRYRLRVVNTDGSRTWFGSATVNSGL